MGFLKRGSFLFTAPLSRDVSSPLSVGHQGLPHDNQKWVSCPKIEKLHRPDPRTWLLVPIRGPHGAGFKSSALMCKVCTQSGASQTELLKFQVLLGLRWVHDLTGSLLLKAAWPSEVHLALHPFPWAGFRDGTGVLSVLSLGILDPFPGTAGLGSTDSFNSSGWGWPYSPPGPVLDSVISRPSAALFSLGPAVDSGLQQLLYIPKGA